MRQNSRCRAILNALRQELLKRAFKVELFSYLVQNSI